VVSNETPSASSTTSSTDSQGSPTAGTTTIIKNYITQPVIEKVVTNTASGVSKSELDAKIQRLTDSFNKQLYGSN